MIYFGGVDSEVDVTGDGCDKKGLFIRAKV